MRNTILFFATLILAALPAWRDASGEGADSMRWQHLTYAIYFTSGDIDALLADAAQFSKTMEYFAPVRPEHVYLEGSSHGEVNVALLRTVAGRFRDMGIRVSGAMVPVGEQGPSTYNNPKDLAALEARMRALAGVFDDIILDDWLFTTSTDPRSVQDRGTQTWAEYRTSLLLEQSAKFIIGPALKVNPKVKITIKYLINLTSFYFSPVIFNHFIWMKNIRTNLITPTSLNIFT